MFVIVKQQNPGSSIVCRFYPFFWHTEVFLDCVTYDSSANIRQARPVPSVSDCFCQHYFSKLNCITISTTISSLWIEWSIELYCISSRIRALDSLSDSRMALTYVFWENRGIISLSKKDSQFLWSGLSKCFVEWFKPCSLTCPDFFWSKSIISAYMWSPCVSILVTIESILYLLDINPLSVNTVVLNKFEELWVHSGIQNTVISISSCIKRMSIKCEELKTFISKWMLYSRVWKSSDDLKMLRMILAFNAFLTKNRIIVIALCSGI